MRKAADLGLDNVRFLPLQPYEDLPALLASSDVLLVPLDPSKSALSVPSKLYNFMAAGRPILGFVPESSEVARIIRRTGCGVVAEPGSPDGLAGALVPLMASPGKREELGRRARAFVEENFSAGIILRKYDKLIGSMISHE